MSMSSVAQRLRSFGLERYGTLSAFAAALEISYHHLYRYLSGSALPGNKLQERLRAIGCDLDWLMTGRTPASAGLGGVAPFLGRIVAHPDGKEYFETSTESSQAGIPFLPGKYFCLEIESDSLINAEPFPIYPGDLCIFEAGRQPKNGDIVAVQLKDGRRLVKIMKHLSRDEVELSSANKFRNYPALRIAKQEIANFGILTSRMQLTDEARRKFGFLQ